MKQQFLKDKASTIKMLVYTDNIVVTPSAATITVYKPGSSTAFIAETAATIDGTTSELSYALTSTHTATNDLNYKAVWKYTVSGTDYYQNQLFDVVKSILAIPIIDQDLLDELPILENEAKQDTGTAASATGSTLVDTNRKEADDYWKGGKIEIINGTGDGQFRTISGNTQSTGTISVSPDWETNPDSTSVYRIIKSYTKQIERAFEKLSDMIYNKGKRHSLILESSQVKIPLIYLALHFICIDLMKEIDDVWDRRAIMYWERFNDAFGSMKLDYDEDESGGISGEDEEQSSPTAFNISRS